MNVTIGGLDINQPFGLFGRTLPIPSVDHELGATRTLGPAPIK